MSLDGSNAIRADERHGTGQVCYTEKWFCEPPEPGQPYKATSQSWIKGVADGDHGAEFLSLVLIYGWEPL